MLGRPREGNSLGPPACMELPDIRREYENFVSFQQFPSPTTGREKLRLVLCRCLRVQYNNELVRCYPKSNNLWSRGDNSVINGKATLSLEQVDRRESGRYFGKLRIDEEVRSQRISYCRGD